MIDFKNGSFVKLHKVSNDSIGENAKKLLLDGENVISVYQSIRDYVIFTDKRFISVNVQGLTGKKQDLTSMPYNKISVFSVETAGTLDFDSELELYFSGVGKVRFEFTGSADIEKKKKIIGEHLL